MTDLSAHVEQARQHVEDAVRKVTPFLEHFARFGFAAKGVTYLLLGFLAAVAPVGMASLPGGRRGALETVLRQPAGWLMLGIVALGLLAFGVWQLVRAVEDPEDEGR